MRQSIASIAKAEQEDIERRARMSDVNDALDAAELAIDEFYNGDREWAELWLLKAMAANKSTT